jgi:hypothetical protein
MLGLGLYGLLYAGIKQKHAPNASFVTAHAARVCQPISQFTATRCKAQAMVMDI